MTVLVERMSHVCSPFSSRKFCTTMILSVTASIHFNAVTDLEDRNCQRLPFEEVGTYKGFMERAKCPLEWASIVLLGQRNAVLAFGFPCHPCSLGLLDTDLGQLRVGSPSQLVVSIELGPISVHYSRQLRPPARCRKRLAHPKAITQRRQRQLGPWKTGLPLCHISLPRHYLRICQTWVSKEVSRANSTHERPGRVETDRIPYIWYPAELLRSVCRFVFGTSSSVLGSRPPTQIAVEAVEIRIDQLRSTQTRTSSHRSDSYTVSRWIVLGEEACRDLTKVGVSW